MKRMTSIATAWAAAMVLTFAVNAGAQQPDTLDKTYLTFSNSVELPGMTLPAGTYIFRLADTSSRDVVQVLSEDQKQVYGQFLFVQAQRPEVTGETVIAFRETAEGTAPAIQYWYYPQEKIGKEFIYPKAQAERIAARTGATVLSDQGRVSWVDAQGDAQGAFAGLVVEPPPVVAVEMLQGDARGTIVTGTSVTGLSAHGDPHMGEDWQTVWALEPDRRLVG